MTNQLPKRLINLTRDEKITFLQALDAYDEKARYNKYKYLFPDKGPFRRELYFKHMKFLAATRDYDQVAFVAASRSGKTYTGLYLSTVSALGDYPDWWEGKVFDYAPNIWISGTTSEKTRESVQEDLLGKRGEIGTGLLPKDRIADIVWVHGSGGCAKDVYVKHSSKRLSKITFKSYEQGVMSFESSAVDLLHFDEEPPIKIYFAGLTRTATTNGLVVSTFTPLNGLSETAEMFVPGGVFPPGGYGPVEVRLCNA